jgi:hypothetical protein
MFVVNVNTMIRLMMPFVLDETQLVLKWVMTLGPPGILCAVSLQNEAHGSRDDRVRENNKQVCRAKNGRRLLEVLCKCRLL